MKSWCLIITSNLNVLFLKYLRVVNTCLKVDMSLTFLTLNHNNLRCRQSWCSNIQVAKIAGLLKPLNQNGTITIRYWL